MNGVVCEIGNGLGGLVGAFEVAAVDRVKGFVLQAVGHGLGLLLASVVEGDFEVALDASCGVPFGFAVADENEFGHGILIIVVLVQKAKRRKCAGFKWGQMLPLGEHLTEEIMKKYRVLVVGAGSIGERHLRCFKNTGRVDVALCEALKERRDSIAEQYDVSETYADFQDALNAPFDAAVVATPAHLHVDMATRLAEQGVHLLIEKPVSTSLDGVENLQQIVSEKSLTAVVGYVHRMHPMLQAMKTALDSGRFGKPVQIVGLSGQCFPKYRPAYHEVYYADRRVGGGAIQDAITHMLNAGEWLVGPIQSLVADADHQVLPRVTVEDTVHVLTRQGSVMGTYTLNQYQAPNEMSMTVVCTEGTVKFERHHLRWGWMVEPDTPWQWETVAELERDVGFVDQAKGFLDMIEGKKTALCTLDEGIQTLRVNLACLKCVDKSPLMTL